MKRGFYIRCDPAAHFLISGEDAFEFLQGQFTNDLGQAEGGGVVYGLWLNQKGRVLADSFVWRRGEAFWAMSEWSPAAAVRERLEAYIIADDVVLQDRTGDFSGWVLGGTGAAAWIEQLGFGPPAPGRVALSGPAALLPSRRGGRGSWRLHVPRAEAAEWEKRLADIAGSGGGVDAVALAGKRLADGVPAIPEELGPDDLPNEGGLERDAISYTKGCYLGQEVMSRLKNLGRVRRRLHVVGGGAGSAPQPKTALAAGERRVGDMRSARVLAEGWIGLAMLHTDHVRVGQHLRVEGGAADSITVEAVAEGRAW